VITTYQSVLIPGDGLVLVGIGVAETLDLTSLATEKTVQVGADLVALTLLQVVALRAAGLLIAMVRVRSWGLFSLRLCPWSVRVERAAAAPDARFRGYRIP